MHRILRTLFWGVVVFAFAWLIASLPGHLSIDTDRTRSKPATRSP